MTPTPVVTIAIAVTIVVVVLSVVLVAFPPVAAERQILVFFTLLPMLSDFVRRDETIAVFPPSLPVAVIVGFSTVPGVDVFAPIAVLAFD
jgi:hypothetical protein